MTERREAKEHNNTVYAIRDLKYGNGHVIPFGTPGEIVAVNSVTQQVWRDHIFVKWESIKKPIPIRESRRGNTIAMPWQDPVELAKERMKSQKSFINNPNMSPYRQTKDGFECYVCGTEIAAKQITRSIHLQGFSASGFGEVVRETNPFCPSCEDPNQINPGPILI